VIGTERAPGEGITPGSDQGGEPDEIRFREGDDVVTRAGAAELEPGPAEPRPEQRFSLREAARILEVPEARLRVLARAGLLAPQRGPIGPLSFGFRDLLLLRTTKGLLESGVPMRRIRHIWFSLREQLASDVPLTSITIRADGEKVVASDGSSAWQADSGQFLLDFEAAEIAERAAITGAGRPAAAPQPPAGAAADIRSLHADSETGAQGRTPGAGHPELARPSAPAADLAAEQLYDLATELEPSSPTEAIEAYRRVLERDSGMADAHVNLGRLYHLAGERGRAEAHYRDAVRLAPDDPIPHFNLGVLMEEQGRREEAALAYRQAVGRDPEFADAHCNLGLLLESLGRRQEATRHLMAARDLYRASD
jgi:Flp pilus assembly protein TadD